MSNCRGGFTFIELTVAVTILAIAAAIVCPAFNRAIEKHRVEQAAVRVLADVRLARRVAQQAGSTVSVDLDDTAHTVSIRGLTDFGNLGESQTLALAENPYHARIVDINLNGPDSITINGFGNYETLGNFVLQSGQFQKTIVISAETCYAQ